MRKHLIPINATLSSLPLALSFKSFGFFKGQMIQQMDTVMAMQKLMTELEKGRRSGGEQGYFSAEDVEKELGIHD